MTYKLYDTDGNSIELWKNYETNKIIIQFDGYNFNLIELDDDDIADLIFALNKLNGNQNLLWNQLSNN